MVLKACPQVADYAPDGRVTQWRDLMSAVVVVRSVLGVSPSAYQEACEVMGPEAAATAMSCILERAGEISNAGGYLRDLTRKAANGRFSPGPMLMALMRAHDGRRKWMASPPLFPRAGEARGPCQAEPRSNPESTLTALTPSASTA